MIMSRNDVENPQPDKVLVRRGEREILYLIIFVLLIGILLLVCKLAYEQANCGNHEQIETLLPDGSGVM